MKLFTSGIGDNFLNVQSGRIFLTKFCIAFLCLSTANCYGDFPADKGTDPAGSKTSQVNARAISSPGVKKVNDNAHIFIFALLTGFMIGLAYYTRNKNKIK